MRIQSAWFGGRALALVALSVAALAAACGGSVILEEDTGEGGSGGGGGGGGSSATSNNGTTGPGPSVVSASSGSMGCVRCAEFITQGSGTLCPESEQLFNEFWSCVCAESCIPQCSVNVCSGGSASDDCVGCINKVCQEPFNNCANDV